MPRGVERVHRRGTEEEAETVVGLMDVTVVCVCSARDIAGDFLARRKSWVTSLRGQMLAPGYRTAGYVVP
jgi:hypothetical protein